MKKQLPVLLFACLIAGFSYAQTTKTELEVHNLKGKVKSVNETKYEAEEKFGELEKGTKTGRYYWEINNAGMETQYLLESYDDGEKEKYVRTTRYENGRAIELKEDEDGEVQLSRMKYNQQGLTESIDALDNKGNLMFRQKNKYNAEGLLIQADSYKGDGSPEMKTVTSYNAKKQPIKEEYYDKDGQMTRLYTYVYDSRGNEIEKTYTNHVRKEIRPTVYKYVYNDKGQKVEERNSISGLDKKEIYEYNAQGDEVRKLDEYGSEEKKVYTYDVQNNWTKCVTTTASRGKTTHEIRERQIKYY